MEIFLIVSIVTLLFVIIKIFSFNKDLKNCQIDILQTSENLKALENKIENNYMPKAYPAQDLLKYKIEDSVVEEKKENNKTKELKKIKESTKKKFKK